MKYDYIQLFIENSAVDQQENSDNFLREGPTVFAGEFLIAADQELRDTYIDSSGWGKVNLMQLNNFPVRKMLVFLF